MTTTPTSGAADLPKALRLAAAISNLLCSNEAAARTLAAAADELVRLHAESEMRRAALLDEMQKAALAAGQATAAKPAAPAGATEMENLQRTAVGWQERALRAERNWVVCRRWAIAGGAPVEKLGDDPDQPFHAASPAIEVESKQGANHD